jgi:hypothetical protein
MVAQMGHRGGPRGLPPVTFQQALGPAPGAGRAPARKKKRARRRAFRVADAGTAQKRSTASLKRTMSPSVWPLPLTQCRRYGRAVVVLTLASTSIV